MSRPFESNFLQSQSTECSQLPVEDKGKIYTIQGVRVNFPYVAYPSQVAMMDKIIRSLRNKQNCLLESPTGSGKSFALLCGALAWQKREIDNILAMEAAAEAAGTIISEHHDKVMDTRNCFSEQPTCSGTKSSNSLCSAPTAVSNSDDDDFQPEKRFKLYNDEPNIPVPSEKQQAVEHYIIQLPANITTPLVLNVEEIIAAFKHSPQGIHTPSTSTPVKPNKLPEKEIAPPSQKFKNNRPRLHRPKIFFCTRTHKQVKQITRELAKTSYNDVKMCILSSREQTCIHPHVSTQSNKNENCQDLLKSPGGVQCDFYTNSRRLDQYTIKDYGLNLAWDLEDMVRLGKKLHFCPYFGLRELMQSSDIIFCPYNYLTDPLIRSSMDISMKGHVVILDEGHNIEDCAREAASFTVNQNSLDEAIKDLEALHDNARAPFARILSRMSTWILRNSKNLGDYSDFDRAGKVLAGQDLVAMMTDFGAGPENLGLLQRLLADLSGDDPKITPVASGTLHILKGLLSTLRFLYCGELKFMTDYRCVIAKTFVPRQHNDSGSGWRQKTLSSVPSYTFTINIWCMNPGVCFSDFHDVHSVIVTSGTLSPMTSFQSELALPFPIAFEANHVIKKSQVWVGTIGCGPKNIPLKAVFKNTESLQFQDELGEVVLKVCQTVPHGILCFFPSYSNLEKMKSRWELTGLMEKIERIKLVVVEPRANNKVQFEDILVDFYSAVEDGDGALFLAVYRGKVSEGLNFSDNNARAVITIGIPYPNVKDMQVDLKQKYNNEHFARRSLMNGQEWYETQAFRALNQALGRCIRHKDDWGALIMVDQRFQSNIRYTKSLSKWIRNAIQHYSSFPEAIDSLQYFMRNATSEINTRSILNCSNLNMSLPGSNVQNDLPDDSLKQARMDFSSQSLSSTSISHLSIEEKENLSSTAPEVINLCNSPELF